MVNPLLPGIFLILSQTPEGTLLKVSEPAAETVQAASFNSGFRSFSQVIQDSAHTGAETAYSVKQLTSPAHGLGAKSLGLGLTYADHGQEVGLDEIVLFEKDAAPTCLQDEAPYRPYLDYETEVGLLLHRDEPGIFGYYIHNDLTDRMVQAQLFDGKNYAEAFSAAKSFPGLNANSPLLVIGDESVWKSLKVTLHVNGVQKQVLEARANALTPSEIHRRVFARGAPGENHEWVILGTGTPAGTIFKSPTLLEKIALLVRHGFSRRKAGEAWVKKFKFLKRGDRLRFSSPMLGTFEGRIQP